MGWGPGVSWAEVVQFLGWGVCALTVFGRLGGVEGGGFGGGFGLVGVFTWGHNRKYAVLMSENRKCVICSSGWTDISVPDGLSPAGNGHVGNVPFLKYLTKLFKNITFRKNPADIDIYGPPNYKCPRFHFSNVVICSF